MSKMTPEEAIADAQTRMMPHHAWVQKWEESEKGWGVRPDGYSLHIEYADIEKYVDMYWASMPDTPPDEHSRPCGTPYLARITNEQFHRLNETPILGIRVYNNAYPGDGGTDSWRNNAQD